MTRVLVKKRAKGREYGPYVYDVHRIGSKVVSKYLGKTSKKTDNVVQNNPEENQPLVTCVKCAHLDTSEPMPFCPRIGAFLDPSILGEPFPCEDFEGRKK